MNLWKLYARPDLPNGRGDNPWEEPAKQKVLKFVVRAESEEEARRLASHAAGTEDDRWILAGNSRSLVRERRPVSVWLDSDYSVCEELRIEGRTGIVLRGVCE